MSARNDAVDAQQGAAKNPDDGKRIQRLGGAENRASFARQAYNDAVMTYNSRREQFPNNVIAGLFAFQETSQLQLGTPEARYVPEVSF
jgi:LemA protein